MFSSFRNRFGIPGVISVIALVFAMIGGAYAASNVSGGDGSKASASAKGKKGPRGPRGKQGPPGPQGPAGPQGLQGPKGDKGDAGAAGAAGKNGAQGLQGLKGATGPTGATGATGSTGSTGSTGATGFSGFTANLPSGQTETGAWTSGFLKTGESVQVPLSFAIPLAAPLPPENVHLVPLNETTTNCTGTTEAPKADPGHLCIYPQMVNNAEFAGPVPVLPPVSDPAGNHEAGAGATGALLWVSGTDEFAMAYGTFAVTGS